HTDLTLSGAVAQYGRGAGMIQATAAALMNTFANNLKAQLDRPAAAPAEAAASPDKAIPAGATAAPAPSPAGADSAAARPTTSTEPPAAAPISGFSLMAQVLWASIKRLF